LKRKLAFQAEGHEQNLVYYEQIVEKQRRIEFLKTFSQDVVVRYIQSTIEHVNRAYNARNRDGIYFKILYIILFLMFLYFIIQSR
jgi:hypothetical protein